MSSRVYVGCSAVVVLMVALGGAADVYEDPPPDEVDTDLASMERSNIDMGSESRNGLLPSSNDVLLYHIVDELPPIGENSKLMYGRTWPKDENPMTQETMTPYLVMLKEPMKKRLLSILGRIRGGKTVKPQRKWKPRQAKPSKDL
ncbi:uncharacterized protein LOC131854392 [Achroia grisella]|uniref:uncharacterized protein LOC131854392 n=1 Tax=Achroia grisella TaxID=688607 RepID=UPI0027D22A5C|nr:uncharacterized protein LOC131854392 [Achroia grisella]